jgi:hypothetical protein
MNKEFLYMQKLAGIITEGEYKEKLEEENINLNKAFINSHEDYHTLYLASDESLNQYLNDLKKDEDTWEPEYITNIDPGKIQMVYWHDEGPNSISFNSIVEYIKETIFGFWGEDQFMDEIETIEDLERDIESNPNIYFEKLNQYINNSYPDGDSNYGVALLIDGNLVAGADNKKLIIIK